MELSTEEMRRYSRHLILPEIGRAGQSKIREARVLCVGAGGLGSPAGLYLAAAGIGTLGIVDDDVVDETNLQRQVLHRTSDVGRPKVDSAREQLRNLNPRLNIQTYQQRLTAKNAREIIHGYDLVIDGSDNFPTRYLVNDCCVLKHKPCVYGAVFRFEGQASLLGPAANAPCYRCLYPQPPAPGAAPSCAEAGVLGVLPGIIGLIQATEALKWILQIGDSLAGRLLLFDALRMGFREVRVKRDPACPMCGERPSIHDLIDYEPYCGVNQNKSMHPDETSVQEMQRALRQPELGIKVLDVRESDEYQLAHVEGVPLLPLSELPRRHQELDPNQAYYIHCKAGGRSMKAVEFLKTQGFKNVKSVAGGISAWSEQIDPRVPKY